MRTVRLRILVSTFTSLLVISAAHADCSQSFRALDLGDKPMRLRAFDCRTDSGPSAATFRVEFHRLSDPAASLLFDGQSSTLLRQTIGSPKVVANAPQRTYADLLARFGQTHEVPRPTGEGGDFPKFKVEGPAGQRVAKVRDTLTTNRVRMLADIHLAAGVAPFYPLVDELRALRRKQIPNGIKFSYAAECAELNFESDDEPCLRYDRRNFVMKFWRGLQSADVARYQERARAYNQLLRETMGDAYNGNFDVENVVPPELKLAQHVAGDAWPEDFVITIGDKRNIDGCGGAADGPHVGGWVFGYWPRKVLIDVVVIENTSPRPITVGGLLGTTVSAPSLRVATSPTVPPTKARAVEMAETLAPGERLLVATRVAFVPNGLFRHLTPDVGRWSNDFLARAGTNGFRGARSSHSVPTFRNYAYGPEINVTGFMVNGTGIDLNQRPSANFGDLAVTRETGSCPFLMSWDAERQEWIDHGKVLDKAPRSDLQYSEVKVFQGFRSRFRIEEREPEIASIDEAELTIVLRNGERRRLRADHAKLAALDGAHLRLYFGEAIEIKYRLPDDVAPEDVSESELRLTGYYERYAALMADAGQPSLKMHRRAFGTTTVRAAARRAAACPVAPEFLQRPLGLVLDAAGD